MTETEKAWYQDGWLMLIVVFVVCPLALLAGNRLYRDWQEEQLPSVTPQIAGHVDKPFLGKPSFKITLWHQHTESLRNGQIVVSLSGELADDPDNRAIAVHSFELWQANRENAISLSLPMNSFDPDVEIPIVVLFHAKNTKPFQVQVSWQGDTWTSNDE